MKTLAPLWLGLVCMVLAGWSRSIAQTWFPSILAPKRWVAITSSANGSNIAALAIDGQTVGAVVTDSLFTSTNSGQTWITNTLPELPWVAMAASADGRKLLAASGLAGFPAYNCVLTSTNFGSSWTTSNVPNLSESEQLTSVASSADGNTLVAVGSYGRIYVSTNGNESWVVATNADFGYFFSVACSADGRKIAVIRNSSAAGFGGIRVSTNWGLTWGPITAPVAPLWRWTALGFSAEGAKLFVCGRTAAPTSGHYFTTNDGAFWTQLASPDYYVRSLAVSADGRKLVIGGTGTFTSTNGGTNWITNTIPYAGSSGWLVASSADGGKLTAANGNSGAIYVSGTVQPPAISLEYGAGTSKLSWIVPSTDFVLEQSPDLTPASWSPVTNLPLLNLTNLHQEVILPATGDNRFFRLSSE